MWKFLNITTKPRNMQALLQLNHISNNHLNDFTQTSQPHKACHFSIWHIQQLLAFLKLHRQRQDDVFPGLVF